MKKWSEIKQATLDKLFLNENEAEQQGYKAKFQYLANECLNIIANGVKPRVVMFTPIVACHKVIGRSFVYENDQLSYIGVDGEQHVVRPKTDVEYYDYLNKIKYSFKNGIFGPDQYIGLSEDNFIMPEDFLSFADIENYVDDKADPEIIYLSDNMINLPSKGSYKIFYNAVWPDITKEDVERDSELDVPYSILNCLPTYMASQLLSQDDVQRSAILKNEFELMLSRLDNNVLNEERHYKSIGGWY